MYLLLIFFIWLEKEQPSLCDTTKADRLDWFLEEVPDADPTWNALKEHLQIFSEGTPEIMIGCVKRLRVYNAVLQALPRYGMGLLPTRRH